MVQGVFVDNVPMVKITLVWDGFVKSDWFILDTGFTGDLQIPASHADELGITPSSISIMTIANGEKIAMPHALAFAEIEGITARVQVGISNGSSLVGISFLAKFGYRAIVDCKYKTVALDKPL